MNTTVVIRISCLAALKLFPFVFLFYHFFFNLPFFFKIRISLSPSSCHFFFISPFPSCCLTYVLTAFSNIFLGAVLFYYFTDSYTRFAHFLLRATSPSRLPFALGSFVFHRSVRFLQPWFIVFVPLPNSLSLTPLVVFSYSLPAILSSLCGSPPRSSSFSTHLYQVS